MEDGREQAGGLRRSKHSFNIPSSSMAGIKSVINYADPSGGLKRQPTRELAESDNEDAASSRTAGSFSAKTPPKRVTCSEFVAQQLNYKNWTLKRQIVCSTWSSLFLVLVLMIISININLEYIFEATRGELTTELGAIETNNIEDLAL